MTIASLRIIRYKTLEDVSSQAHTHTIWTHLKNPCMTCLSGLSLSLGRSNCKGLLSLGPGNCVRLSFTFVFPATLKRWSLPGQKWWGKLSELNRYWHYQFLGKQRSAPKPHLLPRLLDSGRDEDSRIDADQCTGRKTEVKTSLPKRRGWVWRSVVVGRVNAFI